MLWVSDRWIYPMKQQMALITLRGNKDTKCIQYIYDSGSKKAMMWSFWHIARCIICLSMWFVLGQMINPVDRWLLNKVQPQNLTFQVPSYKLFDLSGTIGQYHLSIDSRHTTKCPSTCIWWYLWEIKQQNASWSTMILIYTHLYIFIVQNPPNTFLRPWNVLLKKD